MAELSSADLADVQTHENTKIATAQEPPIMEPATATEKTAAPQILSNQLLVPKEAATAAATTVLDKDEKMDELTSLERAIAEMHHVDEDDQLASEKAAIEASAAEADENLPLELQAMAAEVASSRNSTPASRASPGSHNNNGTNSLDAAAAADGAAAAEEQSSLDHDDLLAVLKGIDHSGAAEQPEAEAKPIRACSVADSVEDVTIEGEGQFQIMDVIDDEGEEEEPAAAAEIMPNQNAAPVAVGPAYGNKSGAPQLTQDEVRAIAMEQIDCLKAQQEKRRARKQDIKPLPLEPEEAEVVESGGGIVGGGVVDLVSQLGADWSDDEASADHTPTPPGSAAASVDSEKVTIKTSAASAAVPVEPRVLTTKASSAAVVTAAEPKRRKTPPKITSVLVLQSGSNSKMSSPAVSNKSGSAGVEGVAGGVKEPDAEMGLAASSTTTTVSQLPPITGFKRTRIIKRKIIWDPDAPETTFSYAQLVRGSSTAKAAAAATATAAKTETTTKTAPKSFATPAATTASNTAAAALNKKEPPIKKVRPTTPKSMAVVEKKAPRAATPSRAAAAAAVNKAATTVVNKAATTAVSKAATSAVNKAATTTTQATKSAEDIPAVVSATRVSSPIKRRSQTPVANGAGASAGGKKKKVTELDRLMGDEGAVNMLNSVESEHGRIAVEAVADDKPHKPLMRSRSATISERIVKRATTPTPVAASAKKEAATATPGTAKNKRGAAANKPKASSSWDYVYKQQASDDSMIIRRRSNSSYSSTTSAHRLSIDGPTTAAGAATPKPSSKSSSAAAGSSKPTTVSGGTNSGNSTSTSKSTTKGSPKTTKHEATTPGDKTVKHEATTPADVSPSKSSGGGAGSRDNTPTTSISAGGKTFEFAKPVSKPNQKPNRRTKSPASAAQNQLTSDMKKATTTPSGRRAARSPASPDEKEKSGATTTAGSKDAKAETISGGATAAASSSAPVSDVVVKKTGKVAQVIFNTHRAKLEYSFSAQMMNKLVEILDQLSADVNCHAVVIMTNAPHFCQGIDCTDLTVGSAEKRKNYAVNLATAVKNYLKTLATFPKPLIAGVNGRNIGLGVTQLPLFDIVVASDKGSYETPYAKLGQVPEGYCIWNNITKIRGTFKTKLFWLCEKLHSTESALSGLVNKLTSSDKVNDDAFILAKKIAAMSSESFRVMKKTTIHNHLDAIITALDEEFDTIIAQWTSAECQENFKKYLETGQV